MFNITAYRFHTKEKNQFVIIGYFDENEIEKESPVIYMDQTQLSYVAQEKALPSHLIRKVKETKITKEYFLWMTLPENWRNCRQITIYNKIDGKDKKLISIEKEQLLQNSERVIACVDEGRIDEDRFYVSGWYMDFGNSKMRVLDMKGNELPVKLYNKNRKDVLRAYPENVEEDIKGFVAECAGDAPLKVQVEFEVDGVRKLETVKLRDTKVQAAISKGTELLKKAYAYNQQFGFLASVERTMDKLFHREYEDYSHWRRLCLPSKRILKEQKMHVFQVMPKISIVVPLYRTPQRFLDELIQSVRQQSYQNWELCLSDGSGKNSPLTKKLKEYEKTDSRIKVVYNEEQLHISANTNKALEICTGDYIAFADHDDLLTPDALYECVEVINRHPETELIYSDEDKVNMKGTEFFDPHFKSDFNLDMLRSVNYFCHLVVVKRSLYEQVGNLDPLCDGAQDYDFVLRCVEKTEYIHHIAKVLYHWRAHRNSTAENPESKGYVVEAGIRALRNHYERMGIDAEVSATPYLGMYRTKYLLKDRPKVSVIIPNKDHIEDLSKCINSLDQVNSYENIEYIIVENNSEKKETFEYYKELTETNPRAKVVYWDGKGFNYPAINTYGVKFAEGDYLLFLNNDTEIINEDCIEEMLSYCMRKDVGAVGARMYFEDGTLQHAGVIVGLGGVAGHAFPGFPHDFPGYFWRAVLVQDLSAVTAACMMMRKEVYEEVGGFEESYAVAFNDVDLCMKIRKAGYLIVYNPYAELWHYESKSRGYEDTEEKMARFTSEVLLFQSRWQEFLEAGDPYYNPNLTLDKNDFSLNIHLKK